jgi:hypothetical protein
MFFSSSNVPRHLHPPGHPVTAEVQNLEELGVDGRILLKWFVKVKGVYKTGTSGGL